MPPNVFVFESLTQTLSTDPKTGHLVLVPSPTCMTKIDEPECGHGVAIMTGDEIFVGENQNHWMNGKPWSKLKSQSIYLPAEESYAPLTVYIINSCKKMGCNADVEKFKIKMKSLNGVSSFIP